MRRTSNKGKVWRGGTAQGHTRSPGARRRNEPHLPKVPRMVASQSREPPVGKWLIRRFEGGSRGPRVWEVEFALDSVCGREPW